VHYRIVVGRDSQLPQDDLPNMTFYYAEPLPSLGALSRGGGGGGDEDDEHGRTRPTARSARPTSAGARLFSSPGAAAVPRLPPIAHGGGGGGHSIDSPYPRKHCFLLDTFHGEPLEPGDRFVFVVSARIAEPRGGGRPAASDADVPDSMWSAPSVPLRASCAGAPHGAVVVQLAGRVPRIHLVEQIKFDSNKAR
jgi:hypothetical protein